MAVMDFLQPYLFGLTLAFSVGPMTLLLIQRGITKGLKSSLITAFALAAADGTYALLVFGIGTSILRSLGAYKTYTYLLSGLILFALAIYIFISALRNHLHGQRIAAAKGIGSDFISAYILTVHNPMTALIFLGFLGYMTEDISMKATIGYAFTLFLGSFSGQLFFACTASGLRRFFQKPESIFILNTVSAIAIAVFAALSFLKVFE